VKFQEICECCDREAKEKLFTTLESERHANRGLNRYRDVNPYDHSRIVLKRGSVDYINANLVQVGHVLMHIVSPGLTLHLHSLAGARRASVHPDPGTAGGHSGPLLADGLGAEVPGDPHAQQADGEEADQMPPLLAQRDGSRQGP